MACIRIAKDAAEKPMIAEGEALPSGMFAVKTPDGVVSVSTDDAFGSGKVVVFGVPGAFTPTCSAQHLPGFSRLAGDIKSKGVENIFCLAVNDAHVMEAWQQATGVGEEVTMLADGSAAWSCEAGLGLDLTAHGMGMRCQRFAMVVEDGKMEKLFLEDVPGKFHNTSAEMMVDYLNGGDGSGVEVLE